MKGLKKNSVRTRKRVIAILLSVLMVLSIVIPSGGSGVRYNAYAEGEESALGEGVDLSSEEGTAEEGVTSEEGAAEEGVTSEEGAAEESVTSEEGAEKLTAEEVTPSEEGADTSEEGEDKYAVNIPASTEEIAEAVVEENPVDEDIIDNEQLLGDGGTVTRSPELINYVSDADAKTGITYDSTNNSWIGVNLDNEYEFTIYFTETDVKQFIEDGANMTYTIPNGIVANNIASTYIDLIYKQSGSDETVKVSNNPFSVQNGVITFNFNTSDSNFETLKNSEDAQFYLTFKGKFDGSTQNINFGNGVTRTIDASLSSDVSVDKWSTGSITSEADSKLSYTVRVKSSGYSTGITLSDGIDNNGFEIENVNYKIYDSYGKEVTTGVTVEGTGLSTDKNSINYTIDKLPNGYYVDFTYDVKLKNSTDISTVDTDGDGKVAIKNTANVTSTEDTNSYNNSKTVTNNITYSSIQSKTAEVANANEGTVNWTIKLNPEMMVSLKDKTLTDVLNDSDATISDNQNFNSDIIITAYDNASGTGTAKATYTVTKPTDKDFSYTFVDTTPYYYIITYQTKATDMDSQISDMKLKNTATFLGNDKTAEATIGIGDKLAINKTATEVTSDYVTWTVTVDVPAKGLNSLVLTDAGPNSSNYYYDDIDTSSINVTGLTESENYTPSYSTTTRGSDNETVTSGFVLVFHKSDGTTGLDATTDSRRIVLTYKTKVDQKWLDAAAQESWRKTHTNNISAGANDIRIETSADATPSKVEIDKSLGSKGTITIGDKKYPYYEFKVRISPVDSDTVTITDTLPEGFKIYEETPEYDWTRKTKAYGSKSVWSPETQIGYYSSTATNSGVTYSTSGNNVTFTVDIKKDSEDKYYDYYWLDYYIIVKDESSLTSLTQTALDNQGKSVLTNTAKYKGTSASINFDFEPDKADSSVVSKELISEENGVATYKIDVNPEKLRLNSGENITLTDTFTNLSIDYSTIKITAIDPANAEVVSCDVRSNVMTVVLKDATHYTIEYKSNVLSNGTYTNVVEVAGFTATKSASYSSSGGGDYGNYLSINIFKQEYGNSLNKLEGVKFQLFVDVDGVPTAVTDERGQIVTATTDENGKATFQGSSSSGWKIEKGKKYYIKELNPPEGYLGIDGYYNFTIADVSDWNHFVYKTGETMRVDNNKIDLKVTKTLDNAPDNLDLSKIKFTVVVSEGEGSSASTHTYNKTLAEIKTGADTGSKWYSYDAATKTYTWYITDLTTGSSATVTETIDSAEASDQPSSITYSILEDGAATVSEQAYTSGSAVNVSGLAEDSIKTIAFTNSYAGAVDVTPVAYKKLDNKTKGTGASQTYPLDGLSFDFAIYEIPDNFYTTLGNHMSAISETDLTNASNWKASSLSTATASDETDAKATFDKINYNFESETTFPQYYYYKIVENSSGYSKITNDTGYVIMSVVIKKDATSGELTKTVTYTKYKADGTKEVAETSEPKAVAFNNSTAETTLSLKANKLLTENGRSVTPGNDFSFKLEAVELNGVKDTQTNANQPAVTNNGSNVTFTNLTYKASDISTDSSKPTVYRYRISENDAPEGYSKDTNYYYVDVTVTRDTSTGGVKTETKITKYSVSGAVIEDNVATSRISFTNTKSARTGSVSLAISKTVDGNATGVNGSTYGKFEFYCGYVGEQSNTLKPTEITSSTAWTNPKTGVWSADTNIITFPAIEYSTANGANTEFGTGKHIYRIYEGGNEYNGINNSRDFYIVVVSVTDPGSGTALTTSVDSVYKYAYNASTGTYDTAQSVSGTGTSNVIFDNTSKQVSVPITAKKTITGGDHSKAGFKFTINAIENSTSGYKLYKNASGTAYTETVTSDADGKITFSNLVFTKASDAGRYQFEIKEERVSDTTITYDESVYRVTVNVTYNDTTKALAASIETVEKKNSLSATYYTVQDRSVSFENKLVPQKGSITFTAQKKLKKAGETEAGTDITGTDGNLKVFSFKLEQVDANGNTVASGVTQTKQNTINGIINFDAITYDNSMVTNSSYYYKISEVASTSNDGYKYSDAVYYVKVDLSVDASTNRVVATPTYYNNVSMTSSDVITADEMIFINEEREATLKLEAHKELVGANITDYYGADHNGFKFKATRDGKTYEAYNDASGNVEISINEVFGLADVINTTTISNAQPYVYTIEEVAGDGEFKYDTKKYTAEVTFTIEASGIVPHITYKNSGGGNLSGSEVKFKNTKLASAEINITALKTFGTEKATPGNKIFSFGLYDTDPSSSGATPIQVKQNDATGNIAFDKIVFAQDEVVETGNTTKTYIVKEIKPNPFPLPGYEYDETFYTITVNLSRNAGTGKIDINYTINRSSDSVTQNGTTGEIGKTATNEEFIQFNNKNSGKTDWPLSVRKVVENNSGVEHPFTFRLYKTDGNFNTEGLSGDSNVKEVTLDNSGYAVFDDPNNIGTDSIMYITNNSTNYYVLEEVNTGDELVSYVSAPIKLKVVADSTGNVTVTNFETNEVYSEARVTFTNSIEVKVKKTNADGTVALTGAELQVKNGNAVVNTKNGNQTTDGNTYNVYSGITVGQEYTLVENKAPVGYAIADPVKFKVVYDSTSSKYKLQVNYGNGYVDVTGTGDDAVTVVMKDTSNKLIINKKISDTTYLAGATLQVKDASGAALGTAWTTETTDGNNKDHSIDLSTLRANAWYTLEETQAPFGYKKATPIQFMIDSDNRVWSKKQDEADSAKQELTCEDGKYTLTMFDEPLELTIIKLNKATDDKLPGAVFSIYAKDGSGLIQSGMEVDSVGTLKLNVLSLGLVADKEYILEETTAPEGFEIINPITFKITNDNTLVVNGENQTGMEIKVYNKKEGTIYISKVDPSNPGVELRGALLVVSQDGTEKYSFTSTANAYEIRTGSLEKNKVYILKEIDAPKDANGVPTHYLAAEIKFYIDNDSELYVQKEGEADFSHSSDGKIVMEDKARDVVKISKVDLVTSDELPGAKLKITDENGRPVYEKKVDEHGSLITTTNKLEHTSDGTKWEIDYSTFELDTPYVLTEITAPDGYEVAEDITFKIVNEGGENVIKIKQTDGSWETNTNMTVVMQDAPMNNVSFIKLDKSSGQTLAGAGLTIYDSYGEIAYRFTTTKNATQFTVDEFNVNEEYTLKETTVPDGFYKADDVVFRVSFVNTQNGRVRKLFVKDTDGTFKVRETGQIVIEDERVYKVKISKVDLTSEEEVPGAHIQILDENGDVVTEWDSTDAPKEIEGLRPNVTYTLRETVAPEGYKITTDTTFALKADATIDYEKTSTAISSEGVLLVKDDITSINFTKYGLVNESCAPDPAAYIPLEGVEFEAYSIDEDGNVSDNPVATAKSSKNGIVVFNKLAKGKYQIRESKSVDAFKICEEYFYATVDDNDFAGLTDEEGNKIDGNRIIDDQYRTDIVFTKVSERNKAKKLAGSTYGLYRKNDSAEETLVATSVSDKEGVVTFKGVLTNINYVVRELESPKGYYISENPMEMSFKLEGDKVVRNALSDGKGTVVLGANGEITWLEPSVIVSFLKVDGDNNPLPGATLAVLDMNGLPVKDADGKEIKWVSTNAAYEVADVFEDGVSYQLVELAAPEGYDVAEPIIFEISEDKVGTGEDKVITVTMIDRAKTTTTVTPPEKTTPPSVKTGDSAPVKPVTAMMFISLAGIVFLLILGRRRKELFK